MTDTTRPGRLSQRDFHDLLAERIVVFDGATGTQLQSFDLSADDFGGPDLEGCNENLCMTRPDVVTEVHRRYLNAGADIIETNTFGGTPLVLAEYDIADRAFELNRLAAQIARDAAAEFSQDGRTRHVAGSLGPTTKAIGVTGGVTFDEMTEHYQVQARGLLTGGVDLLSFETCQDTLNVKAGLRGIRRAQQQLGTDVPVMLMISIETMGTMLAGQSAEALYTSVEHYPLVSIGLNCATGPEAMTDHLRALAELAPLPTSCIPNAGLPDEDGIYHESPEDLARKLARFCEQGFLNIVGGCCGTGPEHVRALADMAAARKPRSWARNVPPAVSGTDYLNLEDTRPVIVGERTNVIGSRKFKRLIAEEKFDEATEIGRRQVRGGAHILDVCLANPDRDEQRDAVTFIETLSRKVRVPLMIDSTDVPVIEECLKRCQGKTIVNSINLEDGEERFAAVAALIREYGGAVIVGCIDEDPEQGMAVTRTRKLAIAERSHDLLVDKYSLPPRDIVFDPLVFPCGTGDEQYIGSARETIEGVRLIKERFPECRTILGISNVSFGLPTAGREALNTVFLHKNFEAGLDMAIVNSEKLERVTHLPPNEIALCEALIDDSGNDPLGAFTAYFKDKSGRPAAVSDGEVLPLDERLAQCVVEGTKEGLIADLDLALAERAPLEIVNGPLMDGMAEVGRLFADNRLIVAEVLQSAEVMKAAVAHLEPHMESTGSTSRGRMLLATVKGDVHDIGKNLVDIILTNNGFEIVNLGIKVPPRTLTEAVQQHKPDFIGLSGLLVKSAHQMVATVEELKMEGIDLPVLVGGAALSERFTYGRIAPQYDGLVAYARDAMTGLDLANRLMDPAKRSELTDQLAGKRTEAERAMAAKAAASSRRDTNRQTVSIDHTAIPPRPPDTNPHVLDNVSLETVWKYINPAMLYSRHLGLRGRLDDLLAKNDETAVRLRNTVAALEDEVLADDLLRVRAAFRFYRAASDGDALILMDDNDVVLARFNFPRQSSGERRCLADLAPPLGQASGAPDHVALMVTTCQGAEQTGTVRELANRWKDDGEYLKSHALQALAIETAEATAEWLHQKLRAMWGFADPYNIAMKDLFQARYRGKRYSPGYPACPRLEDQAIIWSLLEPDRHVRVRLTDGFMMDPEASVSAFVFHHPQATYFRVDDTEATTDTRHLQPQTTNP